jgi:TPR repeat protein
MYENGYGIEKDKSKAVEWYKKAAEQDYQDAKSKVKSLSSWWF